MCDQWFIGGYKLPGLLFFSLLLSFFLLISEWASGRYVNNMVLESLHNCMLIVLLKAKCTVWVGKNMAVWVWARLKAIYQCPLWSHHWVLKNASKSQPEKLFHWPSRNQVRHDWNRWEVNCCLILLKLMLRIGLFVGDGNQWTVR